MTTSDNSEQPPVPETETKDTGKTLETLLRENLIPIAVSVFIVGSLGIAGYHIYEHETTGGAGRLEATDMAGLDDLQIVEKKRQFFSTLRPVVEAENARVLELRAKIIEARDSGDTPGWIEDAADDYGVEWSGDEWSRLLGKVDAVPVTLTLAQAANESSWGQSRFAQEGNNLFGEWCFKPGCGIVPQQRPEGEIYEVQSFSTVNHSVRSYIHNINTHNAYRELRAIRAQARASDRDPTGVELAAGLIRYSERGEAYVEEIRATIRRNRDLMLESEVASNDDPAL